MHNRAQITQFGGSRSYKTTFFTEDFAPRYPPSLQLFFSSLIYQFITHFLILDI
jgi:hypothetical protein